MAKQTKKLKKPHNGRIRKGDKVYVINGNDKGHIGPVLSRTDSRLIIQGVNMCKKHVKRSEQYPQGGVIEIERAIHISNVRICIDEDKPVKIKVRKDEHGNRELYYQMDDNTATYRSVKKS